MRRLVILLLTMCMLLCFLLTGCGKKSELEGIWHAQIDLTDYINESSGNEELSEYVTITYFGFDYFANFREDGTYEFEIDSAGAKEMYDQVRADFKDGVIKYFEAKIEENNANVTVEELLERQGSSLDALVEDAFPESKLQSLIDSLENEGKYESNEGKLYLSPSLDTKPARDTYEEYTLNENTLTLTAGNTQQSGEFELFPMVFEKIG